jgi:ribulose-phosphate 3-epimerase
MKSSVIRGEILAPSILAYDNCRIADGVKVVENSPARWLHVDVMDGTFVPAITFGQGLLMSLRRCTSLFLDVHLMVERPDTMVASFAHAGADMLTFHCESSSSIGKILDASKKLGCAIGIAINPGTPIGAIIPYLGDIDAVLVMGVEPGRCGQKFIASACEKIRALASMREKLGLDYKISVDGGINCETFPLARAAGADVFVIGSAFFANPEECKNFFAGT